MKKWIDKICAWLNRLPQGNNDANVRRAANADYEDLCQ